MSRARLPSSSSSRLASTNSFRGARKKSRTWRRARHRARAATEDPFTRFAPPSTSTSLPDNGVSGNGISSKTTLNAAVRVSARVIDRARMVLQSARVGDLLRVTRERADASANANSAADERWFVVTGVSLSAGGRKLVLGCMHGVAGRILDQGGANQARIGGTGASARGDAEWLRLGGEKDLTPYAEALAMRAREVEREEDESTLVIDIASALTFEMLERSVRANASAWTNGEGAHTRRVVINDMERATKMAGELLALKYGAKNVALVQLASDQTWEPKCDVGECVSAPYASQVLEDLLRNDPDVGVAISRCSYPDGDGITGVVYRKGYAGVAKLLADMGAQAARPIAGASAQILVGLALGYSEENITYHVGRMNVEPIAPEVLIQLFEKAREKLERAKLA